MMSLAEYMNTMRISIDGNKGDGGEYGRVGKRGNSMVRGCKLEGGRM